MCSKYVYDWIWMHNGGLIWTHIYELFEHHVEIGYVNLPRFLPCDPFFFRKPQQKWLVTCLQCPGALFKMVLPHQPQRFWKFLHPSVTQVQKGPGLSGIPFGSGWKFDHISQTSKYLTWNRQSFIQILRGTMEHMFFPEKIRRLDAFPAFAGRQSWSGGKTRWINALGLVGWFYRGHWRHWAWRFWVPEFYFVLESCCIYCIQDSQQALVDPPLVQVKVGFCTLYTASLYSTSASTCERCYSRVRIVAIVARWNLWQYNQKSTQQIIPLYTLPNKKTCI